MKLFIFLLVINFFYLNSCTKNTSVSGFDSGSVQPVESNVSRPVLWKTLPASWDENWFSSPAVFDLDNDGNQEIIASRHSVLYVWNNDGSLKWRAPVGENSSSTNDHVTHRMYCSPAVGDLDNDGFVEIVFTTYSIENSISNLIILNHRGKLLHRVELYGRGSMAAPCLADIDGDNILEIIISLKDTIGKGSGGVQIWKIQSASKNILDWATGRGNYLRTGVSLNK